MLKKIDSDGVRINIVDVFIKPETNNLILECFCIVDASL